MNKGARAHLPHLIPWLSQACLSAENLDRVEVDSRR
jgi:hypothetical protein